MTLKKYCKVYCYFFLSFLCMIMVYLFTTCPFLEPNVIIRIVEQGVLTVIGCLSLILGIEETK